ncbi:6-hydroxynicotinate 3-monooxygenase, partial [Phtheirospermum japonicum]
EVRCVRRKDLLETLQNELPQGTIRYSSKVVSIDESENFKLIHLADGSVVRTKVLIGCDGVNSKVAKWLGLQSPVNTGRSAIRGFVDYPNGHGFEPKFHTYFGGGLRCGFIPCDDRSIYWFCTFRQSDFKRDENEQNPLEMRQFVLNRICNAPEQISDVIERTELDCITYAPLKFRLPWNVLFGNIVKNNVCVAGDALHPMPPDIGQGGCSSLEDGVVLAKCIGQALLAKPMANVKDGDDEHLIKIGKGLQNYSRQRRWRSFSLIGTAYVVGLVQESDSRVMGFLRKAFLSKFTIGAVVRMAEYDCGKLV